MFSDDSEFFQELFTLPPETGKEAEGTSIDLPLHVEGVTTKAIVPFLRFLFPRYVMVVFFFD